MVGAPKHLLSLRKADAVLLVECRTCQHRQRYEPELLARDLIAAGGNLAWSELRRQLPCMHCTSSDVRLLPGARTWGEHRALSIAYHQRTIDLAMAALSSRIVASKREAIASPEVRIALRLLRQYVRDDAGLIDFWRMAQAKAPDPWTSCQHSYYLIAAALREAGWNAPVF